MMNLRMQAVDSKPAGPPERKMLDRVIEKLSKKDPHRIFQRPVTDEEVLQRVRFSACTFGVVASSTVRVNCTVLRLAVATIHRSVECHGYCSPDGRLDQLAASK